jgi:hypothetical protein
MRDGRVWPRCGQQVTEGYHESDFDATPTNARLPDVKPLKVTDRRRHGMYRDGGTFSAAAASSL